MVTIEDNVFRVVGILDDRSTSIYMPISMAYQVITDKENGVYDTIIIKVTDEDRIDEIINKTQKKLINIRHVTGKTKDFSISSNAQMQATRSAMMSSMNNFLIAIAAVSLIVGAVGIANTMFTSVLEKTKEIGIMKAIGAKNSDVIKIFLIESSVLGLVGGVVGIILGIVMAKAVESAATTTIMIPLKAYIGLDLIVGAILLSLVIGTLSGVLPARRAAQLEPVDALRYE